MLLWLVPTCRQQLEGRMISAGQNLRVLRDQLGLTMRDVENASLRIAQRHGNEEFAVPPSRLSDIETKGIVPSIYRLYSLAVIYRQDPLEIFALYGVNFNRVTADVDYACLLSLTSPRSCEVFPRSGCRSSWIPVLTCDELPI